PFLHRVPRRHGGTEVEQGIPPRRSRDRVEPLRPLGAGGLFRSVRTGRAVLHRDPAAERDRHVAHGACVPAHDHGRADPLASDARPERAVAARHRPRRHRDADGRRASAERGGHVAARDRPRALHRAGLAWKERSGGTISKQMRRLGASVDWSRDRFTMDEGLSRAVVEVFVRLYDEGLIYRGKRLVNWDPVLHTALSDLEVLSSEEKGKLWRFRYPLADGEGYLVVATTRPETMLGDTAVAVH